MRKNLFTIASVCLASLLAACSQQPSADSYTLTGTLSGLPDGTHIQLLLVGTDQKALADTTLTDGKFTFTGSVAEPTAVYFSVKDAWGFKPLILSNGSRQELSGIVGEGTRSAQGETVYNLDGLKASGSPLTEKYLSLLSLRDSLDAIHTAYYERYDSISQVYGKARVAKDAEEMKAIEATEEYKAFAKAEHDFFTLVEKRYTEVITGNKDDFFGPLMMLSLYAYLTPEQLPLYESFSDAAKQSIYGKMVKESVAPESMVGKPMPAFSINDREGKTHTLASLCQDKKYILIDFWASWCNPCRKEIPNLKKIYAKHAGAGFQIVSISIDKKEAEWIKALEEEKLPWQNFRDTEGLADLYKVKFVPTMYLVDAEGKLVAENLRGEELAKKINELFK